MMPPRHFAIRDAALQDNGLSLGRFSSQAALSDMGKTDKHDFRRVVDSNGHQAVSKATAHKLRSLRIIVN